MKPPARNAEEILQKVFSYDEFRGNQRDIIDSVIGGSDALVLMPTGGGKSLCYQIPALVRPGTGVVISPLVALMHDQVAALTQLGVPGRGIEFNQELPPSSDVFLARMRIRWLEPVVSCA